MIKFTVRHIGRSTIQEIEVGYIAAEPLTEKLLAAVTTALDAIPQPAPVPGKEPPHDH